MLLRYSLHQEEAARASEKAVDDVMKAGYRTPDLAGEGLTTVGTKEMGRLVAEAVRK